jgi:hypothetical protein
LLRSAREEERMLTEAERLAVFEAYKTGSDQHRDPTDCYRAATKTVRSLCPGMRLERAAQEAVRIVTGDPRFVAVVRRRDGGCD